MDQNTRERHTARCYGLWAAATNYRRYNTDMATADKAKAAANQLKAAARNLTGQLLLIAVVLLAGLSGFYLLLDWNQWAAAVLAIAVGCTGGRHRAPHFSRTLLHRLISDGHDVSIHHRDADKPVINR